LREAFAQCSDDYLGVIDAQRGLREEGNLGVCGQVERLGFMLILHDADAARRFADGADDFVVPFVPDQQDRVAFFCKANRFEMHLRHERACRVDGVEIALLGRFANRGGDAVRAVEDDGVRGNLVNVIDEDDAALFEAFDDVAIVNDLVVDVKRSAEDLQSTFETVDGHIDAGTKPARIGEDDFHANPPWMHCIVPREFQIADCRMQIEERKTPRTLVPWGGAFQFAICNLKSAIIRS